MRSRYRQLAFCYFGSQAMYSYEMIVLSRVCLVGSMELSGPQ